MRFLYIVLVAIGLFGCGVAEDTPVAPAPVVNVEPPDVTIQPTEVTVQPPDITIQPTEVTVQPPDITIQPTEVTVQPPDITIQPTEVTVQPPDITIQPTEVTVQPPTVNVLPPGVDSTPPVILSGTVTHEENNVNPDPINAAGFQFHFNESVTGIIKLKDETGANLNWLSNVAGKTGTLIVSAGQQLTHEQTYIIEIAVADAVGNTTRRILQFVTMIKGE